LRSDKKSLRKQGLLDESKDDADTEDKAPISDANAVDNWLNS